jgi:pimeloyl-ACP methyl ester carboxylesterase
VLEDPPWWASETKESLREMFVAWRQNLEALQSDSVEERMAYVREQNPQLSAEVHRAIVEARRTVDPALIEQVGKAIPHWREVVPQIGYPALLVCGNPSKGAIVTPEQALEIHQLNARVEVAMISGAGHATHRDSSDDYVAAIVPFIRRFV